MHTRLVDGHVGQRLESKVATCTSLAEEQSEFIRCQITTIQKLEDRLVHTRLNKESVSLLSQYDHATHKAQCADSMDLDAEQPIYKTCCTRLKRIRSRWNNTL